jgi:Tol biopolymer transport system component
MKKLGLLTAAVAAATALAVVPAQATFKGANGLLVYQAQVGNHIQLFSIRPDGGGARQLTRFTDSDGTSGVWSPDARKLVFQREWGPNKSRIYTMNADGSGMHEFDSALRLAAAWLPNGRDLLVLQKLRWTIVTASGTKPRDAQIPGTGGSPCVFADGRTVAMIASLGRTDGKAAIFVGKIGGGNGSLKRITPWQTLADKIDCSPDGTHVAFSAPSFDAAQSSNVYTIGVHGTGLRQLTHDRGGTINDGLDSWSPDGKKIAFVSNKTGTYEIYSMNVDGTGVRQITRGPESHSASWGSHP